MNDTRKVLEQAYPSYHRPLEIAREWVRAGGTQLAEGISVLQGLRKRHCYALVIGQELVFALLQAGRQPEAVKELDDLERQFTEVDEETLCRRGRCYKEAAEAAWKANDLVAAEELYRRALACYSQAYEREHGHYSGINKATVLLMLAAVARERGKAEESGAFQRQAEAQAHELLARRDKWQKKFSDDNIWHLATAAEAHLLIRQWAEAEQAYRRALAEPNVTPFHRETTGKQARRILDAVRRIGVEPGALGFLLELFAPASGQATP